MLWHVRALPDFFLGVPNGVGQRQRILRRGTQQEKSQPLRRFLADSRKMLQLFDESFNRCGKIWHL